MLDRNRVIIIEKANAILESKMLRKIAVLFPFAAVAFAQGWFIAYHDFVKVVTLIMALSIVLFFLLKPRAGLLGLIAADFLLGAFVSSSLSREFFIMSMPRAVGFILLIAWVVQVLLGVEKPRFIRTRQNMVLLLYFLSATASASFSKLPFYGLLEMQTLLMQITLYFLVMSMIDSPKMIERIVWTIVLISVVSTFIGVHKLLTSNVIRLQGTRLNSNVFAATNIVYLSVVSFQLYIAKRLSAKIALATLAGFLVFTIVTTGSRANFIALCLVGSLFIIQSSYGLKNFVKVALIVSLVVVVFLIVINKLGIPIAAKRRIFDIPSPIAYFTNPESIEERSARSRAFQIVIAKEMLAARPILGHGPRTYIPLEYDYIPLEYRHEERPYRAAHNMYLTLLAEHGILGTALFLCLIWLTLRDFMRASACFRSKDNTKLLNWTLGIGLSYVALLFLALASDSILYSKYLFIAMALAPILRGVATQEEM